VQEVKAIREDLEKVAVENPTASELTHCNVSQQIS